MQKKAGVFIVISLVISGMASGQFKKGMRMAGADIGSIFFNSGTADVSYPSPTTGYTSKTTSFGLSIAPSMGFFISENLAIGVTSNINPTSSKTSYEASGNTYQEDKSSVFNIGIGAFARNYFASGSSSFKPFGQLSINMGVSSQHTEGFFYGGSGVNAYKQTYDGKSSGGSFINATVSLGMTKMLNAHTGLDFFAGYTFSHNNSSYKTVTKRDDGNNGSIDVTFENNPTTNFSNHGVMLGVGFQVFLEPRK